MIDLFVNITDELIPPWSPEFKQSGRQINSVAFILVLIQVTSIMCAVLSLISQLFDASDLLIKHATLKVCKDDDNHPETPKLILRSKIPYRSAMKLVLDKYWWSLVVGSSYMVITIILQIVRLDPSWHDSSLLSDGLGSPPKFRGSKGTDPWMNVQDTPHSAVFDIYRDTRLAEAGEFRDHNSGWIPIFISMFHKLMSTCYYVTFVVINRTLPRQMMSRILSQEPVLYISAT